MTRPLRAAFVLLTAMGLAAPAAAAPTSVLARGSYGTLGEDDANAFYEALLFSLGYVGRGDVAAELPRDAVVAELARIYPSLPGEDQRALASASETWAHARTNWAQQTPAARQEFVRAVLAFAFGEQATGGGGAAAPSGGGAPLPSVDAPYAGSDCWASAGCSDYDAGTGTYTYDDYSSGYTDY